MTKNGIFIRLTPKIKKSVSKTIKTSPIIQDLEDKGYSITESSLVRFGLLYTVSHLELLIENPDLLLTSGKIKSTENRLK